MSRTRMLVIGLVASLAINTFAIAYGATVFLRQSQEVQLPALQLDAPVDVGMRIADLLPSDAAAQLRGELRRVGPQIIRQMQQYRRALADARDLLEAEVVDREALKLAVSEARARRAGVGDLLTEVFVETAAELPIETRRTLLQRIRLR